MATECYKRSTHSMALIFGRVPDLKKPDLEDVVKNKDVLKQAQVEHISEVGYNLDFAQDRALMAVQKLLDRTDYKGNAKPITPNHPYVYHYYDTLPVLSVKLTEYLEAYGLRKTISKRHKMEFNPQARRVAIDALKGLSDRKGLLLYEKSAGEESSKMLKVEAVDPLIRFKKARGDRQIEIIPNPVLVDHIESYFILTPTDLLEIAGNKSIIRVRFLEFLLYQADQKRRQALKDSDEKFEIRMQSDVMAHWLRLNGLLNARAKAKLRKTLTELYVFGVEVGFLDTYALDQPGTKNRKVDVLQLNKAKFEEISGKSLVLPVAKSSSKRSKV